MRAERFVVLCTMRRGVLKTPELLDDANQWRAFSAWRMDVSREERIAFETEDARVVWAWNSARRRGLA